MASPCRPVVLTGVAMWLASEREVPAVPLIILPVEQGRKAVRVWTKALIAKLRPKHGILLGIERASIRFALRGIVSCCVKSSHTFVLGVSS